MDLLVKTCSLASLLRMIDVLGEEVALAWRQGYKPRHGQNEYGSVYIHSSQQPLRDLPESANADLLILCMYEN